MNEKLWKVREGGEKRTEWKRLFSRISGWIPSILSDQRCSSYIFSRRYMLGFQRVKAWTLCQSSGPRPLASSSQPRPPVRAQSSWEPSSGRLAGVRAWNCGAVLMPTLLCSAWLFLFHPSSSSSSPTPTCNPEMPTGESRSQVVLCPFCKWWKWHVQDWKQDLMGPGLLPGGKVTWWDDGESVQESEKAL